MDETTRKRFIRGALAATARRVLNLRLEDAARAIGLTSETVNNAEIGRTSLSAKSDKKLLLYYLTRFHERGCAPAPDENLSTDRLRRDVGESIIRCRAMLLAEAAAGSTGGVDNFFIAIVKSGFMDGRIRPKTRIRLAALLAEFEGSQELESAAK